MEEQDDVAEGADAVYPTSRLSEGLDVSKWTNKVEVRYFGRKKGKGLVAKEKIEKGEYIWKEGVFVDSSKLICLLVLI